MAESDVMPNCSVGPGGACRDQRVHRATSWAAYREACGPWPVCMIACSIPNKRDFMSCIVAAESPSDRWSSPSRHRGIVARRAGAPARWSTARSPAGICAGTPCALHRWARAGGRL